MLQQLLHGVLMLVAALQDLQHGTMAGVLDQLQQWSAQSAGQAMQQQQQQHAPSSSQQQLQPDSSSCDGLLPTVALSLASSTNTAEAYAHLLCTMKQQVRSMWHNPCCSSRYVQLQDSWVYSALLPTLHGAAAYAHALYCC